MKKVTFGMVFGIWLIALCAANSFAVPTLYLQTVDGNGAPETGFCRGGRLYVHIGVRNAASVAGCAFTLNYPSSLMDPVTTDAGQSSDIIDSPIFTFDFEGTQTHRENAPGNGQILFSGAIIAGDGGAKVADPAGDTLLFQVTFRVKEDLDFVGNNYSLSLTQTELWNPQAGWGTDINENGLFDEGEDDTDLVSPVLIGAVDSSHGDYNDFDCADGNCAYPHLIENLVSPVATNFAITICEPPVTFTQEYQTGMNLVPFTPTDSGIVKASDWVAEIESNNPGVVVEEVLGWNAVAQAYVHYLPDMSPPTADFTLVPGAAYFIDVSQAASLQLQGLDYASAQLYPGWNLMAVPYGKAALVTASDFKADIEAHSDGIAVLEMFGWDAVNQRYTSSYISQFGVVDFNLAPGTYGYFVRISGQGVYEPYR